MAHLERPPESYDLVWSEGALYNIGMGNARRVCPGLLRPGGDLAFTDAVWRKEDPPPEVKTRFDQDYPTMGTAADGVTAIQVGGFECLGRFTLPDEAWWDDFYTPMEQRIAELRWKYDNDAEALAALDQLAREPEMHRLYSDYPRSARRLEPGTRVLDFGSGSGEMLCTWARDHGISGTGIDMSPLFTEQAKLRAEELGVADQVTFIHGDAAGYVSDEKVGVAACLGATWIGGGVVGTLELLAQSLRPGGILLVGEPYWRQLPPTEEVAKGCLAGSIADFLLLPELLASFGHLGYDVVEMVLADPDSWDRYVANWAAVSPAAVRCWRSGGGGGRTGV